MEKRELEKLGERFGELLANDPDSLVTRASSQSRYNTAVADEGDSANLFYNSVLRFTKEALQTAPDYKPDSRTRDGWLRDAYKQEPHMAGMVSSTVSIYKNRGWSLKGGRNMVLRYQPVLRYAGGGEGWRTFKSKVGEAFCVTDMGPVVETDREALPGPLTGLYAVDPVRVKLLGGLTQALRYYPQRGRSEVWHSHRLVEDSNGREWVTKDKFFRIANMPSTDERFHNLGYSPVSRALTLMQIMLAVHQYDQEMLGARAPQGLLLLHNISQNQWNKAMSARNHELDGRRQKWFNGVVTLAGAGAEQADAKLIALSNLPANFDKEQFVELTMYGMALCFGFDPREYWPAMRGGLGHSTEASVQHQKATAKGGLDLILDMQMHIQDQLPNTVAFNYDQRDDAGQALALTNANARVELVSKLLEAGVNAPGDEPVISTDEARFLLAEYGIIPEDWTAAEEPTVATDDNKIRGSRTARNRLERLREEARKTPEVLRSVEMYPNEPIIRYRYPEHQVDVIWDAGSDMYRATNWAGVTLQKPRQLPPRTIARATLFENDVVQITDLDVENAIKEAYDDELKALLLAEEREVETT